MRWITDEADFKRIFLRARTCVYMDSGREPITLKRLNFDDAQLCTHEFTNLLKTLMGRSRDATVDYIVLDPDPVHYFHRHFGKYPAIEINSEDSSNTYLSMLNEDPGGSIADAVGINWWACVVVPPSLKWFVHILRSERDDSGHLWIPSAWMDELSGGYPFLTPATVKG